MHAHRGTIIILNCDNFFIDADTDASDDYADDVCSSNEESETVYQSVVDPDVPLIEQE